MSANGKFAGLVLRVLFTLKFRAVCLFLNPFCSHLKDKSKVRGDF